MNDKMKILVVDDEEINVIILEQLLLSHGYRVIKAFDGVEALRKTMEEAPELILLDIMMPEMDGYEVVRKLKQNEETRSIPVIIVTSLEDRESRIKAIEDGADDFLSKPVDELELSVRVKSLLEKKYLRNNEQAYLKALEEEKEKSEVLLRNVLPDMVVGKLKEKQGVIAETHDDATVLFADIVGFTELSSEMTVSHLVTMLNKIFSVFDNLIGKHGLEKIKTIGDAYMIVGGIPHRGENHPEEVAEMALDMLDEIGRFKGIDDKPLKLRIGIHTGPVMAGVIGLKKFIFDLWGDTVNIASRMESHGVPGSIQVSTATYQRLRENYLFEKRGVIHVKGKGEMSTYFLLGKRGDTRSDLILEEIKQMGEAGYGLTRAQEELKTLSLSDDLTGLHSRNGIVALVHQQMKVAEREERRVLMMLVRLENLEWINTKHSVHEGEKALKNLADLLYKTFRISDLMGRVGENLFLVFGLEVSDAKDEILRYRFKQALDASEVDSPLAYPLSVTMATSNWNPERPARLKELLKKMEKNLT